MYKFVLEEKKLTQREVTYWTKVFDKNLMIGTEMELEFDNGNSSDNISGIKTTGGYTIFGTGIESVKYDGSLNSGAEILTPGRVMYGVLEQYSMYQNVLNQVYEYEPILKPNASWHNHLILDNYGIDKMETPMPSVIFRNVLSLCKIFAPALCYITSTMPEEYEGITRYDEYCRLKGLLNVNIEDSLSDIMSYTLESRYNAINVNSTRCDNDKDIIKKFHIEFRFPDQSMFPTQQACLNVLWKAILMKAIKLSEFGVLDDEVLFEEYDIENLYQIKNGYILTAHPNCVDSYSDGDRDDRMSSMLKPEFLEKVVNLSKFMIDFFENDINIVDKLALPILKELAVKPISIMLREESVNDWVDVNVILDNMLDNLVEKSDVSLEPLSKIITLGEVKGLSKDDWFEKVGSMIAGTEPLEDMINRLSRIKDIKFTESTGYYYEV